MTGGGGYYAVFIDRDQVGCVMCPGGCVMCCFVDCDHDRGWGEVICCFH